MFGARPASTSHHSSEGKQQEQAMLLMERQNNDEIGHLHSQIRVVHALSVEVNAEVQEQNQQLDELDDAIDKNTALVSGSMKHLDDVMQASGGGRGFGALIAFAVSAFLVCYWIAEHRGTDGT